MGSFMTDQEQADAAVAAMLAGGWNHESVFKAPAEALSDWLRDHGRDDLADAVLELPVIVRVRDKCQIDAGEEHKAAIREHVKRVVAWLSEQAKWMTGDKAGVHVSHWEVEWDNKWFTQQYTDGIHPSPTEYGFGEYGPRPGMPADMIPFPSPLPDDVSVPMYVYRPEDYPRWMDPAPVPTTPHPWHGTALPPDYMRWPEHGYIPMRRTRHPDGTYHLSDGEDDGD